MVDPMSGKPFPSSAFSTSAYFTSAFSAALTLYGMCQCHLQNILVFVKLPRVFVHAKTLFFSIWLAGSALLSPGLASADPTRPPPGLSGATVAGQEAFGLEAPLIVQSVFLTSKRPYAIVDDMTVRVGDRLADSRVSKIDEHGVWLGTRNNKRLLKLTPDVSKTTSGNRRTRMEMNK
jgi:hypothetical protein